MADEQFGLTEIRQVAIVVRDLKKSVQFYRDLLGIKFLFETPSLAFFECSGVRIMLALPEKPEDALMASIVYFKVSDIKNACGILAKRGVQLVGEPHVVGSMGNIDVWMVHFRDVDNHLHALTSEVQR
jgi:catechol 2,3-dioxygenase-like lactoylglutathione lyase family enzyme